MYFENFIKLPGGVSRSAWPYLGGESIDNDIELVNCGLKKE